MYILYQYHSCIIFDIINQIRNENNLIPSELVTSISFEQSEKIKWMNQAPECRVLCILYKRSATQGRLESSGSGGLLGAHLRAASCSSCPVCRTGKSSRWHSRRSLGSAPPGRRPVRKRASLFESFPYACPEPVLVKWWHFQYKNGIAYIYIYDYVYIISISFMYYIWYY